MQFLRIFPYKNTLLTEEENNLVILLSQLSLFKSKIAIVRILKIFLKKTRWLLSVQPVKAVPTGIEFFTVNSTLAHNFSVYNDISFHSK